MSLRITRRQTTFWDFAGSAEPQRVHFIKKQEQSFVAAECDGFEIVSDHSVLLNYHNTWCSVYINAPVVDPAGLLEHLAAQLAILVGPWRSPAHYFNRMASPLEILRSGSGLLLHAPQPLADRMCAALNIAQVSYSAIPASRRLRPMQALVAGANFVVAHEFRIERGPNISVNRTQIPLRGLCAGYLGR